MFLRDGKSKNSPRDIYIIEDQEDEFYIIRKFNTKLRQRVYKALPDELISVPVASNQDTPTGQQYSKAGRPIRAAARHAHGLSYQFSGDQAIDSSFLVPLFWAH